MKHQILPWAVMPLRGCKSCLVTSDAKLGKQRVFSKKIMLDADTLYHVVNFLLIDSCLSLIYVFQVHILMFIFSSLS